MRRVVFNQKGGVGKTSITCNLAAVSAQAGFRTLVVDLDPQGNSTHYLMGKPSSELEDTIGDFFEQQLSFTFRPKPLAELIHATPFANLELFPASPELDLLESKLESRYKIYKLREALDELAKTYDRIYIDTPPALNFFSRSALIAADHCLIPFDCDAFSRQALYSLLGAISEMREDHNKNLQVEGIIVNQMQPQARLPQQLIDELVAEALPVLPVHLMSSIKMRESHQVCKPLIHLVPKHKLARQFVSLHGELEPQSETV